MVKSSALRSLKAAASPGDAAAETRRANAVIGVTGGVLGATFMVVGTFVSFRPNRIVAGETATALEAFGIIGWILVALWLAAAVLALVQPGRLVGVVRGVLGGSALLVMLAATGEAAAAFAAGEGPVARTSFGVSFYISLLALFFVVFAASADTPSRAGRSVIAWTPVLGLLVLALSGSISELGIVREWTLTRATFARELTRHLFYALGATVGAIIIGVPLGIIAAKYKRAEGSIMGVLNLGQVLPALAFVGIMMPILGALSDRISIVKALGISGIGWAPVFVVLLVYALFPITRNTFVAIRQLDPSVLDTAKGMGMGRWRLLGEVELPLAFPLVLAGVRIALVQSTAGAIIAAFVGGGGLGAIMFFGLEQTSMDLVLVGVLPIVALALLFDAALRAFERMVSPRRRVGQRRTAALECTGVREG